MIGLWCCSFPRRRRLPWLLLATLPLAFAAAAGSAGSDQPTVFVVVGAPGAEEYGSNFLHQATLWREACTQANCTSITIGLDPPGATNDCERLQQALAAQPHEGPAQLWLVLIGHGTFDGKEARFNLRGPDLSGTDLTQWLQPFHRPLAVIDTSSASSPFLIKLSGTNRVVISATRSGNEQNFARFGQYFAEAINNPAADLDKDGQVSLLEAFLTASRQALEFYQMEGRLATEHALLDDNGDGLGTPADWFHGLHATRRAKDNAPLDGLLARQWCLVPSDLERQLTPDQRARRDTLEHAVLALREKKAQMAESDYYHQIEILLLEMARLYSTVGNRPPGGLTSH